MSEELPAVICGKCGEAMELDEERRLELLKLMDGLGASKVGLSHDVCPKDRKVERTFVVKMRVAERFQAEDGDEPHDVELAGFNVVVVGENFVEALPRLIPDLNERWGRLQDAAPMLDD